MHYLTKKLARSSLPSGTIQISDAHLGAAYSNFQRKFPALALEIRSANPANIVLNGDILDFEINPQGLLDEALRELEIIRSVAPDAHIHILPGNHDCAEEWRDLIEKNFAEDSRLHFWSNYCIIDKTLYTHGDMISDLTDLLHGSEPSLCRVKALSAQDIELGFVAKILVSSVKSSGLVGRLSEIAYPRDELYEKIFMAIEKDAPETLKDITDIVVGHVHPLAAELNETFSYKGSFYRVHISAPWVAGSAPSILHIPDSHYVAEGDLRYVRDLSQPQGQAAYPQFA